MPCESDSAGKLHRDVMSGLAEQRADQPSHYLQMALTLIEAAKRAAMGGNVYEAAIIRQYAESSPILENLSFRTIQGNALTYNRQDKMPGIGFRGINEGFSESTGVVNPQTESLAIAGGDLDVDMALIRAMGEGIREDEEMNKVESLSLAWTRTFIKGDSSVEPREFDGLQKRITGTQLIPAGNTSGGDPLSLNALDYMISRVRRATHLIMNVKMRLRLTAAARNNAVGGYVNWQTNEFGRQITTYQGLPILELEEDNNGLEILPFAEANPGGGTPASTSIYCVSMGPMMLQGLQNMDISVRDLGELEAKPSLRTRVEWEAGFGVFDGRSVARLSGVRDAAITA